MTLESYSFLVGKLRECLAEVPKDAPADWCAANVIFDEASYHGPFSMSGAEYMREVINCFAFRIVNDIVLVWGSQARKTGLLMGGVAWCIVNDPSGILWVMPTQPNAKKFSRQRLQPLFKATDATRAKIPKGASRHAFSTLEQILGATTLNLVGSNSPANLASNPCRRVIQDETDKFDFGGREEASAWNLADQRTKAQVDPQRWKTSTPSIVEGPIWQEFLKGDQRRYFIPCPICGKDVILAWSKEYTVFRSLGCEAFVRWDKEARRDDRSWDFDRVARSARFECPHCAGHIREHHKPAIIAAGKWSPTNPTAPESFRSYHLSSLYATAPETAVGLLAIKFLQAKASLEGVQGFINGDLAEPYQSQDTIGKRVELIRAGVEVSNEKPTRLFTIDTQARAPFFYWVARDWYAGGSHGVACGTADTFEELDDIAKNLGIPENLRAVDSGYGAKSDAEVYASCARNSTAHARQDRVPLLVGMIPTKGFPGRKRWASPKDEAGGGGVMLPFYSKEIDPFEGTSNAGLVSMTFLGFAGDHYKDILEALRSQKKGGPFWSVSDSMASDEYWRHLDGEVKKLVRGKNGQVVHTWLPRNRHWPNHWLDCEVQQLVLAQFLGIFTTSNESKK